MSRGKFIVIEGIDGSGKSTQVKKIKDMFFDMDLPVHITRECTDNPIGKLLRDLYLPGKRKCDERVINMLYAADRLDHITNEENGMLHYLENGVNVVSDRYYLSSLAYDTYSYVGTSDYYPALRDIANRNRVNMDLLTPDVTIYIDVYPEVASERIQKARGNEEITIYENLDKLNKIYKSYKLAIDFLHQDRGENIRIVDGMFSQDIITQNIKSIINSVLNK